jgi:predicted nuclease with TOPRIM domain
LEKEGKALVVELEESRKNASGLNEERAALVKENESLVSEKSTLEDALKRSRQEFKDVQKVNLTFEERNEVLIKEVKSLEQANKALVDSQIPEDEFLA